MKILFDRFFSWLWSLFAKPRPPVVVPPVVTPPVVVPPPVVTEPVPFTSGYFKAGSRWEKQTGIAWLHRLSRAWTTVLRIGGWDFQPSAETTDSEMLADTRRYLSAIMGEPEEARGLLVVTNYVPGKTTDAELDAQLECYRHWWDRVIAVETVDEFGGEALDAERIRKHYLARMAALNLQARPLYAAITDQQALHGVAWHAWDWIGLEFYRRPPYTESAAEVVANLDAQLARVKAAGLKIIAVIEAYSHNYDADPQTVPAITHAGFQWALRHKGDVIGTMPFSFARPSGALEYPDVLDQVKRGHSLFFGLPDPGPEVPVPVPPPPPYDPSKYPGAIQPAVKAFMAEPGTSSVDIKVIRYDGGQGGTKGVVKCGYHTEDSTGVAGTEYKATSGVITWVDGENDKWVRTPYLPGSTRPGSWEARLVLHTPTGGATIVDGLARFGAWSNVRDVGFTAPELYGVRGNSQRVTLRRSGDVGVATRVLLHTLPGPGTELRVDYEDASGWITFEAGQVQAYVQVPILATSRPGRIVLLRLVQIGAGPFTISQTVGESRIVIH